jgi:hypothetical protein
MNAQKVLQAAKSVIVGFVLVVVVFFVLFFLIGSITTTTGKEGYLLFFVAPALIGTILSAYLTASDVRAGAVTGVIAAILSVAIISLVFKGGDVGGWAIIVGSFVLGGAVGGAAGGYLKQRKLRSSA